MENPEDEIIDDLDNKTDKKIDDSIKAASRKTEAKEPESKKPEKESQWDKEKQFKDQYEAETRKLRRQLEDSQSRYDSAFNDLKEQLANINEALSKKYEKTEELPELDPTLVDGTVIKYIKSLKATVDKAEKRLAESEKKISMYEEQENRKTTESRKSSTVEKILKPLDEEFGAKFRQKAIDLADKMINDGDVDQPTDALEASQLMRKCYKQLSQVSEVNKKPVVDVDDGKGTVASEKKAVSHGKLEDVWMQMRKEGKFKP